MAKRSQREKAAEGDLARSWDATYEKLHPFPQAKTHPEPEASVAGTGQEEPMIDQDGDSGGSEKAMLKFGGTIYSFFHSIA